MSLILLYIFYFRSLTSFVVQNIKSKFAVKIRTLNINVYAVLLFFVLGWLHSVAVLRWLDFSVARAYGIRYFGVPQKLAIHL